MSQAGVLRARSRTARAIDPTRRASARFVAGHSTLAPNGGTAYEFTVFDSEPLPVCSCDWWARIGGTGRIRRAPAREVTLVEGDRRGRARVMKSHARMSPAPGQQFQSRRPRGELGPCAEIKLEYVLEVVRGGFLADHQHPCDSGDW